VNSLRLGTVPSPFNSACNRHLRTCIEEKKEEEWEDSAWTVKSIARELITVTAFEPARVKPN